MPILNHALIRGLRWFYKNIKAYKSLYSMLTFCGVTSYIENSAEIFSGHTPKLRLFTSLICLIWASNTLFLYDSGYIMMLNTLPFPSRSIMTSSVVASCKIYSKILISKKMGVFSGWDMVKLSMVEPE